MSETRHNAPRKKGPPMGGGMVGGEKPKHFKNTLKKLVSYIGVYKIPIIVVMILAAIATVFAVAGPKIMAKATNALFDGLMLKIAVVGGAETVMGFKALGLEACPVANAEEARETLRRLTKDSEDYAIIYVEENLAQELQHEIDKFKDVPKPAIILIPGREGPLGLGQTALKAAVERAVGSDIL